MKHAVITTAECCYHHTSLLSQFGSHLSMLYIGAFVESITVPQLFVGPAVSEGNRLIQ